ncbi:MAG: hypothetical protein ACI8XB_002468 [Patiriisocius sp.]|jgi:uncharacterized protein (DUF2147 family)
MKNATLILVFGIFSLTTFGQKTLDGNWVANSNKNTVVKIVPDNGVYSGEIILSDNQKAVGTLLIKDALLKKDIYEGRLYSPKRKAWYDAEFEVKGNTLEISISVGFFSKTMKWVRVK